VVTLLPDLQNISLDHWDNTIFRKYHLHADVLRLDKIHPEISGNKWFKLKYYFEKAVITNKNILTSFGGPYSNHLLALAVAARINGFSSVGYIRGEEPISLSHTLTAAKEYGMELRFLSRADYSRKKRSAAANTPDGSGRFIYHEHERDSLLIPEGGAGFEGIRGAEEILSTVPVTDYSHICCAVGTGTTLAGIINRAGPNQQIRGVSVLKGARELEPLDMAWIKKEACLENVQMIHDGHFGGYAKYSKLLIDFMNQTFTETGIPTDFVYTAKLFHSIVTMAGRNEFPPGSRILVLHTGGLQGNRSLEPSLLQF
jgi:1-aminocyclopropane-1-carboxylate deaminase